MSSPIDTEELSQRLHALVGEQPAPADGFVRVRARGRRRQARRVFAAAVATAAVLVAAAVAAVDLRGGGTSARPAGAPTAPPTHAPSPAPSPSANFLYTVVRRLPLPDAPGQLLALDRSAVYVTVPSFRLLRVDRRDLAVTASAHVPSLTDVAVGAGWLWAATGWKYADAGCNCTPPPPSRLLVKLDPTSLTVAARFTMPGPPVLVTVAAGQLWVATPDTLLHVDPSTGQVLTTERLGFYPVAMAASPNGQRLYLLGGKTSGPALLADYDPGTGRLLARVRVGEGTDGPLAVTATGAWVPDRQTEARPSRTVIRFYRGPQLVPAASAVANTFNTDPYAAGDTLWLVGAFGGATVCADAVTGRTRRHRAIGRRQRCGGGRNRHLPAGQRRHRRQPASGEPPEPVQVGRLRLGRSAPPPPFAGFEPVSTGLRVPVCGRCPHPATGGRHR